MKKALKKFVAGISAFVLTTVWCLPDTSSIISADDYTESVTETDSTDVSGIVYGDLDRNGKLNIFDLLLMKRMYASNEIGDDILKIADVSGDKRFDMEDIGLMQKYLVRKTDSFPVQEQTPEMTEPVVTTVTTTTELTVVTTVATSAEESVTTVVTTTTEIATTTVTTTTTTAAANAYNGIKYLSGKRKMEKLDRGIVAVRSGKNVFVSWRLLASDESDIGFNVYRQTGGNIVKLNDQPLTNGTNYTDSTADLTKDNSYYVTTVYNGVETGTDGIYKLPANKASGAYVTVPIKDGGTVHFVWVGDFNGDGAYDYLLDRCADDHQKLEAYLNDGTYLWTIDMGYNSENKNNISPGASTIDVGMWDGCTVYDMDCDGYADVCLRIADGVKFGDGKTYSDKSNANAQAIAVIDGRTGALKASVPTPTDYIKVGPLACMMQIGYLDGVNPSLVCWMKNRNSDKSFNSLNVAYSYVNGEFKQLWKAGAYGAEAHQIRLADVNSDGKDELLHMGYCLNSDGSLRYKMPDVVHGDRWFVGAFSNADNVKELMGYGIQQENPSGLLEYFYNASTGKIIWKNQTTDGSTYDVGRGSIGDIDPNYDGVECYSFQGMWTKDGKKISDTNPYPSFRIFWDGDLLSDSYNDGKIEKWNYRSKGVERLATTWKIYSASGSDRGVGMFHGDILGDWREESILVNYDTKELVIYTTDVPTDNRIYCLAQNPCYRNCMTGKGYYQSNMLDYFLGDKMNAPKTPDIRYIGDSVRFDENAIYQIKNASSGRVLDVSGGKGADGTNVQQYAQSAGKAANTWNLKSAGDGYYYIISEIGDGKTWYLDVNEGKNANSTNVQIWSFSNSKAQQFKLIENSDGSYTITARCSLDSKCVEVTASSSDAGANVQIYKINGGANQHWFIDKIG